MTRKLERITGIREIEEKGNVCVRMAISIRVSDALTSTTLRQSVEFP